jgi:hypothetical protein
MINPNLNSLLIQLDTIPLLAFTCAGLTVYLTFVQAPGSGYDYNISVIGR